MKQAPKTSVRRSRVCPAWAQACACACCALGMLALEARAVAPSTPHAPAQASSASAPTGTSGPTTPSVASMPAPPADRTRERAPVRTQGPVTVTAEKDGLRATLGLRAPDGWQPGAPIEGEIAVTVPAGMRLDAPHLGETLGAWDVRDARVERGPTPDARVVRFTLRAWDAGPQTVPAISITALTSADTRVELALGPVEVELASLLGSDTPLTELAAPIRGPVEMGTNRWWWYALAALGAGLTLWLAAWLFRRGRAEEAAPPLPADQWALLELGRLEAERLPARGEFGRFFVRLSDILRHYVEQRWGISAPEQTTQEFLRAARAHAELAGGHEATLGRFLRSADMVKFAAVRPAAQECDSALDLIRGFVHASAPPPPREASDVAAPGPAITAVPPRAAPRTAHHAPSEGTTP